MRGQIEVTLAVTLNSASIVCDKGVEANVDHKESLLESEYCQGRDDGLRRQLARIIISSEKKGLNLLLNVFTALSVLE